MHLQQLLYFSTFPMVPLMAVQGRYVRSRTPMLPEAGGARIGEHAGEGPPMRILVLGESTAAGCGVSRQSDGMGGQLAQAWTRRTGQAVSWQVVGRNGVTARDTRQRLLPLVPIAPFDLAVIILGVNDTKNLTSASRWQSDLQLLFADLRDRIGPVPLLISAVPPMGSFPGLPWPLGTFLGLRASLMDGALQRAVSQTEGAIYAGPISALAPEMFSIDRFHPGERGYAAWADGLAEVAIARLRG